MIKTHKQLYVIHLRLTFFYKTMEYSALKKATKLFFWLRTVNYELLAIAFVSNCDKDSSLQRI